MCSIRNNTGYRPDTSTQKSKPYVGHPLCTLPYPLHISLHVSVCCKVRAEGRLVYMYASGESYISATSTTLATVHAEQHHRHMASSSRWVGRCLGLGTSTPMTAPSCKLTIARTQALKQAYIPCPLTYPVGSRDQPSTYISRCHYQHT